MTTPAGFTATAIPGLLVLTAKSVTDGRGTVREFYRDSTAPQRRRWTQVNLTTTRSGAVRGLHGEATTKLIGLAAGSAFGAYLDTRADSPQRGTVVTMPLSTDTQVLVPPGVCNGFQATGPDGCAYLYLFDQEWSPGLPGVAVHPLDPDLAIAWPLPIDPSDRDLLSAKDAAAPHFVDLR